MLASYEANVMCTFIEADAVICSHRDARPEGDLHGQESNKRSSPPCNTEAVRVSRSRPKSRPETVSMRPCPVHFDVCLLPSKTTVDDAPCSEGDQIPRKPAQIPYFTVVQPDGSTEAPSVTSQPASIESAASWSVRRCSLWDPRPHRYGRLGVTL